MVTIATGRAPFFSNDSEFYTEEVRNLVRLIRAGVRRTNFALVWGDFGQLSAFRLGSYQGTPLYLRIRVSKYSRSMVTEDKLSDAILLEADVAPTDEDCGVSWSEEDCWPAMNPPKMNAAYVQTTKL